MTLVGASTASGAQHRLKGRCPDGDRCVNTQTPCSQLCLRLQSESIAEELQRHARADRPPPKKKLDPVRVDDLFDLRDVVHSRSADGHPLVVPDPGTDHGRALVKTLGAQIEEEDSPMETAQAAAKTHYCKFPSCTNESRSSVGRYAYCEEHRDRAARGLDTQPDRPAAASNGTTVAARISALAADARKVDKARARAKKMAESALAAKRHADQLQATFDAKLREQTAA